MKERLQRQIEFLLEIDKLKSIFRRNFIADGSRSENDAEHSWHFATAAMLLAEHARTPVDAFKVTTMGLIHDIVEIDAGDTFIYDDAAKAGQREREERAAERLFGLLPADQAAQYLALWREFEDGVTPEARFARSIDRLVAVMLNYRSGGKGWRAHQVPAEKIMQVNSRIENGSPALWDFVREMIEDAVEKGFIEG
ncbi:MAG: HD domain-containing protein [Spirochaetes bacterium]|nr:MAG: HD domain-containing protein [Spirochaetota bacterium]